MLKKTYFVFFLFSCVVSDIFGFSATDAQVSLLTVMPRSNEVYTVYGHTAIRICNPRENLDIVFNYGTFNSNRPNFIYHFIKGETDYYLDASDFRLFEYAYQRENSTVIEQVLNIPPEEKEKMFKMLSENLLPENRGYRYNYFFDNCTSRARDIFENFADGHLVYAQHDKTTTFRNLVHQCTSTYKWMTFGIDLLIGNGADSLISFREEMFLPEKLMTGLASATVVNDSLQYPVVVSTHTIIEPVTTTKSDSKEWSGPMKIGIILVIHALAFGICGIIFRKKFRIFFGLIFLQAALAGCLVWFVALISVHPCTYPNYNMFWLHPFYLIAVFGCVSSKTYRLIKCFHWSNFVLLSLFLLLWKVIPQELNAANIPFILCLCLSSGFWLLKNKHI